MSSWTAPITWTAGGLVTKSQMDVNIRDNTNFLYNATHDWVVVNETKATGSNGGTFTSGAWRTRILDTLASDDGSIASLSANRVTLEAGTYVAWIIAPAASNGGTAIGSHQARLQNITAGTTIWYGSSETVASTVAVSTNSVIFCLFTLAVNSALEVQHQCQTTIATVGFGVATGFGGTEQYTQALFIRIDD